MGRSVSIDLAVRVFHTDTGPGAVQLIRLFQTRSHRDRAFRQARITHDCDYSFVHVESPGQISVRWKNKAGPITFCGSGAYAVAGLLFRLFRIRRMTIKGGRYRYGARRDSKSFWLSMPRRRMTLLQTTEDARLFYQPQNGILILEFSTSSQVRDTSKIRRYIQRLDIELHGVCAFSFNRRSRQGVLRYFVPWHGRDEDYVTGSIHQWLTPLVYRIHRVCRQTWTQLSGSLGRLVSSMIPRRVAIRGMYECAQLASKNEEEVRRWLLRRE